MLVFVSDLHISDRTTGVQFLEVGAFVEALPNIARQASQAQSEEVTFVFLGDIFDMVRTTFWTVPGQQQEFWQNRGEARDLDRLVVPWEFGVDETALQEAALFLLEQRLLAKNDRIFDLWSQPLVGRRFSRDDNGATQLLPPDAKKGELIWPYDKEPRRVYVPGNHDRILNQFPLLRAAVIKALGLNIGVPQKEHLPADGSTPFDHFYHHPDYKVFGRHGQEWDTLNFEYAHEWNDPGYQPTLAHYLEIPIGELIATEFSRLPDDVSAKLKEEWDDKTGDPQKTQDWADERARIAEQLNVIDDVRPMAAVVPWLFDSLSTNPILRPYAADVLKVLLKALDESATRLENLPYMQDWLIRHNQPLQVDETDSVRLVLNVMQTLRTVARAENLFGFDLYSRIRHLSQMIAGKAQTQSGSNYEQEALNDLRRVRAQGGKFKDTLYILYGHTHHADQVPLTVPDALPRTAVTERPIAPVKQKKVETPACAVYLNTGTWRPLSRQARNQDGFMRWKNMTFTLFYSDAHDPISEAKGGSPTFETWTGSLLAPLT